MMEDSKSSHEPFLMLHATDLSQGAYDFVENGDYGYSPERNIDDDDDDDDDQVNEDDMEIFTALENWLTSSAGILSSRSKNYAKSFISSGIGSISRLGKKLSKDDAFLSTLAIEVDDIEEIKSALISDGIIHRADSTKSLATDDSQPEEESKIPIEPVSIGLSAQSSAGNPDDAPKAARRMTKRASFAPSGPSSQALYDARALAENLRSALDCKMEMAILGVLGDLASFVAGSSEKQKALYKADAPALVSRVLVEQFPSVPCCEKALQAIALLCRHTDADKASISIENTKAFGNANANEYIATTLQKHSNDAKVLEAACDAVRCLCILESNRVALGEAGVCEILARALGMTKFMNNADNCAWICRALGHLANNNVSNREKLGLVGACETIVGVLETHKDSTTVLIDIFYALRNIAPDEGNKNRIDAEYGGEQIVAMFSKHGKDEKFMIEASKALVACFHSEDDPLIAKVVNAGMIPYLFKATKKHLDDSEVLLQWILNVVYYVSCDPRLCTSKLLHTDIYDTISLGLERHAHHEGVGEWACRTVHNLAQCEFLDGTSSKMRTAGLCEMVVSCVQRQSISKVVSGVGCMAIGDLAMDKHNHSRLSQSSACEAVVGALKRHVDDADVVFQTCHAIHYLSDTPNHIAWMGANDGCMAVAKALAKHTPTSLNASQSSLRSIGSLAHNHEANMLKFNTAGACNSIATALRTHGMDNLAAEYACRAVYNLCGIDKNVAEFGNRHMCGLVVAALKNHKRSTNVITQACLAISGLAVKLKSDKVHNKNTDKLIKQNVIDDVVDVLRKYDADPEVQRAGAMAVAALARTPSHRQRLGDAGVVALILSAMATHATNDRVLAKLFYATDVLCTDNDVNRGKFAAGDIIEILHKALKKHERSPMVVAQALRAIITMAVHEGSKVKVRTEASLKLYVKVVRAHETDEEVAKWGCSIIFACSSDELTLARLGAAKGCETVIALLLKHGTASASVGWLGCRAVFALCAYDQNRPKFHNSDTVNGVVNALSAHPADANVAEWACATIVRLAKHEPNKAILGRASKALCETLKHNMGSAEIVALACEAVCDLAGHDGNRLLLGEHGACEILTTALGNHKENPNISQQICRAIAGLARFSPAHHSENPSKFGAAGVCEILMVVLKLHCFCVPLVEWACAAIAAVVDRHPNNQAAFSMLGSGKGDSDIGPLFTSVLQTHRTNTAVCGNACRAVRNLTTKHPDNTRKMAQAGIVSVVLRALKTHKDMDSVVEHACWILGHVVAPQGLTLSSSSDRLDSAASPDSSNISRGQEVYENETNWDLLLVILQSSLQKDVLTRWVCAAVSVFAQQGKRPHVPMCDAVIAALNKYMDKEQVASSALCAIGNLAASNPDNQSRLTNARACETVDHILTPTIEGEAFIYGSLCAVHGLASGSPVNQARFNGFPNLCKSVVRALYEELESEHVARWGCAAISSLAWMDKGNQTKLAAAANYLADIFPYHKGNPVVVTEACRAISALSHKNMTIRNKFGAADVCEHVSIALNTYSQNDEVVIWVIRAIADLAANNPSNQAKLGLHGACAGLVDVLKRVCPGDDFSRSSHDAVSISPIQIELAKWTCWAVGNIIQLGLGAGMIIDESNNAKIRTKSPSVQVYNTTRLGSLGAAEVMLRVLTAFADVNVVVYWASRALNNMSKSRTLKSALLQHGALDALEQAGARYSSTDPNVMEWINLALATLRAPSGGGGEAK